MKKWMQSLVAAALLVSMVAVEAVTPMTAYATEAEGEEETEVQVETEDEMPDEVTVPETVTETKEPAIEKSTENVPKVLENEEKGNEPETETLSTPELGEATASASGTKITWLSVSDADSYEILRKLSGGSWEVIGYASGTSYTDTSELSGGKTYYYTVRACADGEVSEYDTTGLKSVYLSNPSLKSATSKSSGTEVSWSSVTGATGYMIFRKQSDEGWKVVTTTTSTNYTDTASLSGGKIYYYTVRAYCGNATTAKNNCYDAAYWGGYDTTGIDSVYLAAPKVSSVTALANGTQVNWGKVTGASGYAIYRRLSSGDWGMIATTSSTSYTDKESLSNGKAYYYTVRAYKGDETTAKNNKYNAAYWGNFSSGLKSVYLTNPVLTKKTETASKGISVSWKKVSGATGYAVYRRKTGSSSGWSLVGTTTGTSYKDTSGLSSGTAYDYTVRAYYGNVTTAKNNRYNAAYWSGYDTSGVSSKYLAMPSLKTAQANPTGTNISWSKVSGASGYAIYRRKSGGDWAMLTTTTSTSYTDTAALSAGAKYYYTVRAYSGNVTTAKNNRYNALYWSHFNSSGKASVYMANPKLGSATVSSGNAKVTWSKVSGAKGYAVYRKKSGGSWSLIATTTSTSYTDKTILTSFATYYYTVRAYYGNVTTAKNNRYNAAYWSGYDTTGLKYVAPEVGAAMNSKAKSYSSNTKYLIMVDTTNCHVGIYTGSKGNWTRKYYWSTTTGKSSTPTPIGQYKTINKSRYFNGNTYTAWYSTRFHNGYCIHSVLYQLGSSTKIKDGRLGIHASHGCVRLSKTNAKWVYDNVPIGTKVVTYK